MGSRIYQTKKQLVSWLVQLSSDQNPGCLLYIGEKKTTQLQYIGIVFFRPRIPKKTNQNFIAW